jgi:hypothetical protein
MAPMRLKAAGYGHIIVTGICRDYPRRHGRACPGHLDQLGTAMHP